LTVIVHQADQRSFIDRQPIFLPSLVWCLALTAALVALFYRGFDILAMLPLFVAGFIPGLLGLMFARIADREWVQIILMLSWSALALLACLTLGFVPMALLFIAVPALASLFEREKVLEATVIAALIAAVIWFTARAGFLPDAPAWDATKIYWAKLSALSGLLAFGLAVLVGAASKRRRDIQSSRTFWRDGIDGGLFEYNAAAQLVGTNEQGNRQFFGAVPGTLLDFLPNGHPDRAAFEAAIEETRKTKQPKTIRISHAGSDKIISYDLRVTPLASEGWLLHAHETWIERSLSKLIGGRFVKSY